MAWGFTPKGGGGGTTRPLPTAPMQPGQNLLPPGALGTIPQGLQNLVGLTAERQNALLDTQMAAQLNPEYAQIRLSEWLNPQKKALESSRLDLAGEGIAARQGASGKDRALAGQLLGLEVGDVERGAEKEQLQLRGAFETSGNYGGGLYGQHKGFIEEGRVSDIGKLKTRHEREMAAADLADKDLDIKARELGIDRQELDLKYTEAAQQLGINKGGLDLLRNKAAEEKLQNYVGPYLTLLYQVEMAALSGTPAPTGG